MAGKIRIKDIVGLKGKRKITMLTAYNKNVAEIIDSCGIDIILIGDSYGMVELGYENTLPVSMQDMLTVTGAVKRGVKQALVVSDMPFMSYQVSKEEARKNAGEFLRAGAEAVKVENSRNIYDIIEAIISIDIPVMGHIGLTPQSLHRMGGYNIQGKTIETASRLVDAAKRIEDCGVFAIVLESIPKQLSKIITDSVSIPTIGIGAGIDCDGQVLVINDMLGFDNAPKHSKVYIKIPGMIKKAVEEFKKDVEEKNFPELKNSFLLENKIEKKLNLKYNSR